MPVNRGADHHPQYLALLDFGLRTVDQRLGVTEMAEMHESNGDGEANAEPC